MKPESEKKVDSEMKSSELPNEAGQHLEQAYNYKEADKFEDALREADAAIQINPSLAEAHNLRGIALEELGHKDEAVKAYRQAIALDPEFREAQKNLSNLGIDLTEKDQLVTIATFTYPKVDSEMKSPELQNEARQYLERAYSYKEADEFENTLHACDAAIQINPYLAEAHNLRGIALEELGHEDEAIKAYRQAIILDPEFREAKKNLSDLGIDLTEKDQFVTIATFTYPVEANIAKTVLDTEGIWSLVADENINRLYPFLTGGIRLQVRQPDVERAFELLNEKPDGTKALDEELGQDKQREKCPSCQSPIVHYEKYNVGLAFLSLLLLNLPLPFLKRKWVCSACGHEWKSKR